MKWELNEIKIGDVVRVNMGIYYHYGICTAEDRIVQFGLPTINLDADTVEVCATDIKTFLCNKFAEVMVLDKKEQKKANNIETIIANAENSLGEKGYNILHNNCEHFVNRCVFNTGVSTQVSDVEKQMFELINPKEIYIAPVDMFENNNVLPTYTTKELKKITNQSLRKQKVAAYGLLKYAVENSFKMKADFKDLKKTKTGKPFGKNYCLSISHTPELVAVVISKCEVGIDIERVDETQNVELLKKSMESADETISAENINEIYSYWTKKEAIFKFKDGQCFNPKQINVDSMNTKTFEFIYNNSTYVLSITTKNVNNIKINKLFN